MAFYLFKNQFPSKGLLEKGNLALDFLLLLDKIVQEAGFKFVTFRFTKPAQRLGKVAALPEKLDRYAESAKLPFYRATVGSAIEAQAYEMLVRQWKHGHDLTSSSKVAERADYLTEWPEPRRPLFPSDFSANAANIGSRPDIRLALGDGDEALYDITAEPSAGHVLAKGGGNWLRKPHVLLIAEVFYDEDEIADMVARRS